MLGELEEPSKKELALGTIDDMVADYAHYDRRNDDELSKANLNHLIESGELTKKEIIDRFTKAVNEWLGGGRWKVI